MSSKTLIVFDLDGTLVDAFADIAAAVNHALAGRGLPTHPIEAVRRFVGNGLPRLCERAMPRPDHPDLPAVLAATRAYYDAHPADFATVYPGMADCVAALRREGFRTAVLSNKPDPLTQDIARRLGLAPLFDAVQGARDGVPLKPDPASLHALLASVAGTTHAVMVGDGRPDAEVAQAAGVPFVGVAWGIEPPEVLSRFGPVAAQAGELPGLIRAVMERAAP